MREALHATAIHALREPRAESSWCEPHRYLRRRTTTHTGYARMRSTWTTI